MAAFCQFFVFCVKQETVTKSGIQGRSTSYTSFLKWYLSDCVCSTCECMSHMSPTLFTVSLLHPSLISERLRIDWLVGENYNSLHHTCTALRSFVRARVFGKVRELHGLGLRLSILSSHLHEPLGC